MFYLIKVSEFLRTSEIKPETELGHLIQYNQRYLMYSQELFQARNHKNSLSSIAISTALGKAASCGDNR